MAFKFVVLAACLAIANAGLIGSPVAYGASPYGYAGHQLAAPLGYASHQLASPLAYSGHQLAYAAPVAHYAAPVAQYAAPVVTKTIAAPVAVTKTVVDTEYDPHPQYSYSYDVQDSLTGDSKSQHETRNGDSVQGSYSLVEADGTRRIVDYTADDASGFNAVVRKEGLAYAAAPVVAKTVVAAPVVTKTVVAAPAVHYAAAPAVHYAAAPVVAKTVVSAPAVHYAAAPALAYSHGAPALAYSHGAPALSYAHGAPALAYSHGAPTLAYSHGVAAPAAYYGNYGNYGYAAPVAKAYYH